MDQSGLPPEGAPAGAPHLQQQPHQPQQQQLAGHRERASRLGAFLASFSLPKGPGDGPEASPAATGVESRPRENYVTLDLVREMIAQRAIEITIILVIVIYLVYYFSKISRKPKLIGHSRSAFVGAVRQNFKQTLQSRFSPLIYFWGTNPQTCLFGYLQGQTSNDEMPRSKFHRQFLYVSDAQYLASNIDLSAHYGARAAKRRQVAPDGKGDRQTFQHHHDQHHHNNHHHKEQQRQRVKSLQRQLNASLAAERQPVGIGREQQQQQQQGLLLRQNLQLVVANGGGGVGDACERHAKQWALSRAASGDCSDSSALSSSSDSGVFANEHASSGSSSSRSSLTIDMSSVSACADAPSRQSSASSTRSAKSSASSGCTCGSLYEPPAHEPQVLLDDPDEEEELRAGAGVAGPQAQLAQQADARGHASAQQATQQQQQQQQHNNNNKQFRREQFEFGQCALDWFVDSHAEFHANGAVALISAGMTTGSDKKYVTDTVRTLHQLGYEVCVFIRRGVGGLKLNSAKFFSPSKWRDFEAAILSIKRQRPNCRLVSIGFSFGSIELCRYLSMSGAQSLVDLALLISCPFDPEAGGRNMRKRALNRKIDAYLAKNLGKQLHQALALADAQQSSASSSSSSSSSCSASETESPASHLAEIGADADVNGERRGRPRLAKSVSEDSGRRTTAAVCAPNPRQVHVNYNGSLVDLTSLPKIKSLVDFEDNYNRVIQHYPNSDAYGADSRLNDQLANIRTPTLCLSSEDDFMAPVHLLPIKQVEANENLCMILTKRGGHMAFIDGLVWPRRPYFAQRIIGEFMKLPPRPANDMATKPAARNH